MSIEHHGLMSGKSTTTNLSEFQHHVLDAFKVGNQVNVIYTDSPKSLDTIDHNISVVKLHSIGFCNPFHLWLISFISNKKQYAKIQKLLLKLF